jgi:hypothetical protein
MDNIIAQVQLLAKTADEAGRKKLIDSLKSLQYDIETPYDTLQRFSGLVSESVCQNDIGKVNAYSCSNFKSLALVLLSIWESSRQLTRAKPHSTWSNWPQRRVLLQSF